MTSDRDRRREGYFWPAAAKKQHYFVDGLSLCGRWGVNFGQVFLDLDPGDFPVCATCERKEKRRPLGPPIEGGNP